jgi:hypothetical protein
MSKYIELVNKVNHGNVPDASIESLSEGLITTGGAILLLTRLMSVHKQILKTDNQEVILLSKQINLATALIAMQNFSGDKKVVSKLKALLKK